MLQDEKLKFKLSRIRVGLKWKLSSCGMTTKTSDNIKKKKSHKKQNQKFEKQGFPENYFTIFCLNCTNNQGNLKEKKKKRIMLTKFYFCG